VFADLMQHRRDVFTGAQLVGGEIRASAIIAVVL